MQSFHLLTFFHTNVQFPWNNFKILRLWNQFILITSYLEKNFNWLNKISLCELHLVNIKKYFCWVNSIFIYLTKLVCSSQPKLLVFNHFLDFTKYLVEFWLIEFLKKICFCRVNKIIWEHQTHVLYDQEKYLVKLIKYFVSKKPCWVKWTFCGP